MPGTEVGLLAIDEGGFRALAANPVDTLRARLMIRLTGPGEDPVDPEVQSALQAAVLAALHDGAITMEEACRRYALSEEELQAWQRAFDTHGLPGLRATRLHARRGRRLTAADPQD